MSWPPTIGAPLPRAEAAWHAPGKLEGWVLAEAGHGPEWARVFHVAVENVEDVWEAIATAILEAPVVEIRLDHHGVGCGVVLALTIGGRAATVLSAWHYGHAAAAPRLVTAYPRLYA